MASQVDICNLALTAIGHKTIANIEEQTEAARKCKVYYQPVVDETLRAYNWNCATARAWLAQETDTPVFGFAFQYALPADCLRVLQLERLDLKFKVEGRKLLTNESTAKILYIKRIGAGEMDPLLVGAVAARLAAELAYALSNNRSLAELMLKVYEQKKLEAGCIDAQEGTPDEIEVDSWLNARL